MASERRLPNHEGENEPTEIQRYLLLWLLCLMAFVFYVDRICISKAGPSISRDLGLTETEMGIVYASFTAAYMLFEIPVGRWGDRHGSRGVLARIVIWWSIFTALTGAVGNLVALVAIRFLFGAGEAGAYPNVARILKRWFPEERRGFAQGMINFVALIGGTFAPLFTARLIDKIGWRYTFVVFSIPGFVWAAVFYWWYRDNPAEKRLSIGSVKSARPLPAEHAIEVGEAHAPIPWGHIGKCPGIWLLGIIMACMAANSYFYFTWFPTYLEKGRGVSTSGSASLASMVLACGALGSLAGGKLIDVLLRMFANRKRVRRMLGFCTMLAAASCVIAATKSESPQATSRWLAAATLLQHLALPSWWGGVADVSGRHLGAIFGLLNSCGGLGAITMQVSQGRFVDWRKSLGFSGRAAWDPLFYVYAGFLVTGAIAWMMFNTTRSIDHEKESATATDLPETAESHSA